MALAIPEFPLKSIAIGKHTATPTIQKAIPKIAVASGAIG
jgi:hypothetical protein